MFLPPPNTNLLAYALFFRVAEEQGWYWTRLSLLKLAFLFIVLVVIGVLGHAVLVGTPLMVFFLAELV